MDTGFAMADPDTMPWPCNQCKETHILTHGVVDNDLVRKKGGKKKRQKKGKDERTKGTDKEITRKKRNKQCTGT
jgi:hypothetical protein